MARYFWNVLVAFDRLVNAILLGDPKETISTRLAKLRDKGNKLGKLGCSILDSIDTNHCNEAKKTDGR